jgi:exodeoxyribonuclease X
MLRYLRKPQGMVHELGLPAHRALPDAYVAAHHLRDMLNLVPMAQLIAWSREPGLLPRVPTGSERGKAWRDLPDDALHRLAADRDIDVRFSAAAERARRETSAPVTPALPAQPRFL